MNKMKSFLAGVVFAITVSMLWVVQAQPPASGSNLMQRVSDLEAAVATLQSELTIVKESISGVRTELKTLSAELGVVRTDLVTANNAIGSLQTDLVAVQNNIDILAKNLAIESKARQDADSALQDLIASLDATALEARVAAIEGNTVLDLDGLLTLDNTSGYATALFSGVNVQVVNGLGSTSIVNGLGNFIVGYNNPRSAGSAVCSSGLFDNQSNCETAGHIWAVNHKSGSHNIVGGDRNAYSQFGGFVVGQFNAITGIYASVSGGNDNIASGPDASVSGGNKNTASINGASVSGGQNNKASGLQASVSGGASNVADAKTASVSGGSFNVASANSASISGGFRNEASANRASVGGGENCTMNTDDGWGIGDPDSNEGCPVKNLPFP